MRALPLRLLLALAAVLLALGPASLAQNGPRPRSADQWYALGKGHLKAGRFGAAVDALSEAVRLNPSAANLRNLGDAYLGLGDFERGSRHYDLAVVKYRALGQAVTADALEYRADQLRPELELYALEPATPSRAPLAKFEPLVGCLLGAYVEQQAGVGLNSMGKMNAALGARHAVYFRYHRLVRPESATPERPVFPERFVAAARAAGAAAHIALEPAIPLREVTAAVLEPFARAARASNTPIFLRFAAEPNDANNEWSRDPALYVQKFRLVHATMRRLAPNVATVWTPMALPTHRIPAYYPGREHVDWVGVTIYSTVYVNGNVRESAEHVNPLDLLDFVYRRYAADHPIQVSEYGAAHRNASRPGRDHSALAVDRLRLLYSGVFLRYPRVKNVNWLSVDMINGDPKPNPRPLERRNDYSLLGSPAVLAAYRALFENPYFLQRLPGPGEPPARPLVARPFPAAVSGTVRGAAWVKAYEAIARVEYRLDGRPLSTATALPYGFTLETGKLARGKHRLEVRGYDGKGRLAVERGQEFVVR